MAPAWIQTPLIRTPSNAPGWRPRPARAPGCSGQLGSDLKADIVQVMSELTLRPSVVEWREVEGEIVALDLVAREYISISRTGAVLWPLLVEGAARKQLAEKLAMEFEIALEAATNDADEFVSQLAERGLLDGA